MARSLSENLQQALNGKGWRQKELAARTGIGQGYISRILQGKRKNPSWEKIRVLAKELEVSLDFLFDLKEPQKVQPPPTPIRPLARSGLDRREPLRALFDGIDERRLKKLRGGHHMRIRNRLFEVAREELLEKGA